MHKIAHLTSVHGRNDTRIFIKQCRSSAEAGFETSLVVADGLPDERKDGVMICGVTKATGRIKRILNTPKLVFEKAVALDADIYQIHDPELIPIGLKLKRLGKMVIFDSHEDVPRQMLSKPYFNPFLLKVIAGALKIYETYACSKFDGIITATPFIRDKFLRINPHTIDVNNFPLVGELDAAMPWEDKKKEVCYVGVIATIRGIREVVQACGLLQTSVRLNLAGSFSGPEIESVVKADPGWARVNELGFVDRRGVREVLSRSMAGLVTLHPTSNYLDSLPVKMFEYMAAGLPVIASDFPLWRKIIVGAKCGLLVDPLDSFAIADAMRWIIEHPEEAKAMGQRGRRAVEELYNWDREATKLIDFYVRFLTI